MPLQVAWLLLPISWLRHHWLERGGHGGERESENVGMVWKSKNVCAVGEGEGENQSIANGLAATAKKQLGMQKERGLCVCI